VPGPFCSTAEVMQATSAPTSNAFATSRAVCTPELAANEVPLSCGHKMAGQRNGSRSSADVDRSSVGLTSSELDCQGDLHRRAHSVSSSGPAPYSCGTVRSRPASCE
jgi:hypothetical protein